MIRRSWRSCWRRRPSCPSSRARARPPSVLLPVLPREWGQRCALRWGRTARPGHWGADATIEEVMHTINAVGHAEVYPGVFGLEPDSLCSRTRWTWLGADSSYASRIGTRRRLVSLRGSDLRLPVHGRGVHLLGAGELPRDPERSADLCRHRGRVGAVLPEQLASTDAAIHALLSDPARPMPQTARMATTLPRSAERGGISIVERGHTVVLPACRGRAAGDPDRAARGRGVHGGAPLEHVEVPCGDEAPGGVARALHEGAPGRPGARRAASDGHRVCGPALTREREERASSWRSSAPGFRVRQAWEQRVISSQRVAHLRRQVMVRPQVRQSLVSILGAIARGWPRTVSGTARWLALRGEGGIPAPPAPEPSTLECTRHDLR